MPTSLFSLAFGVGTQNRQGNWLEVFYAQPLLNPAGEIIAAISPLLGYQGGNQAIAISTAQAATLSDALKPLDPSQCALLTRLAESQRPLVVTLLETDAAPASTPEAYLKLRFSARRPHRACRLGRRAPAESFGVRFPYQIPFFGDFGNLGQRRFGRDVRLRGKVISIAVGDLMNRGRLIGISPLHCDDRGEGITVRHRG